MNLSRVLRDFKEKRILKEALTIYNNIIIRGNTVDGVNYSYTYVKREFSKEVLEKLNELVSQDNSTLSVKYVSVNFVPMYTFNIYVPVVDITNNVKTLQN